MDAFTPRLGHAFDDPKLLRVALTHPSAGGEDNQRMEFLGDAILEYIVSEALYAQHGGIREGGLTRMRAALVCEASLADAARGLGLGAMLVMSRGEEQTGGRERESILCDTYEAVLAAIYLDGGIAPARAFVQRTLLSRPAARNASNVPNPKGALQEAVQALDMPLPSYETTLAEPPSGADNAPRFCVRVSVGGRALGEGEGRSKKEAETRAAREALRKLTEGNACG